MASKPLIIASLIGASIGVPYFTSRSKSDNNATANPPSPFANTASTAAPAPPLLGAPPMTSAPAAATTRPAIAAAPVAPAVPRSPSAEQALQFNVTKEWVYRSWDRKSSGPTDLGLFAVRVPLVSGTQSSSLAGALTYYFNTQNQVEYISFRGTTGDPTRLVRFLTQTYQFQPVSAQPGEQVYQVADRGGVHSELRTRPVSVVSTTSPYASHSVELELARPGSERYMPPRGPFLQLPQSAAAPSPLAAADAGTSASAASGDAGTTGSGYLDKIRYATPQEASQTIWKRWPN
jgi:hypothetical protein